jgi:putative photosynthetic complex assembly protein
VSHAHTIKPIPRSVLISAAAMIATTIALAGAARMTGLGTTHMVQSAAVESLELRFADQHDGSIAVSESTTGRIVAEVAPGTNGFLRSTLRGLARERKRQGIGAEPAFRLVRWADGRLTLEDPATLRVIDLAAFGQTNAGAFADLLVAGRGKP